MMFTPFAPLKYNQFPTFILTSVLVTSQFFLPLPNAYAAPPPETPAYTINFEKHYIDATDERVVYQDGQPISVGDGADGADGTNSPDSADGSYSPGGTDGADGTDGPVGGVEIGIAGNGLSLNSDGLSLNFGSLLFGLNSSGIGLGLGNSTTNNAGDVNILLSLEELIRIFGAEYLQTQPETFYAREWGQKNSKLNEAQTIRTGAGVTVAVLDTGLWPQHPMIPAAPIGGFDLIDGDSLPTDDLNEIDDNENGVVDEGSGHGTHVTSIILSGAPEVRILPVRVLDSDGRSSPEIVAQGIRYAADQGANIINLSLSGPIDAPELRSAAVYAFERGALLIAAGASSDDLGLDYPAGYPGVISVGSINASGAVADFAQSYATQLDIFAPGMFIYGAYHSDGVAYLSGNSMATAFVSATAALLMEDPNCDAICAYLAILGNVEPIQFRGTTLRKLNSLKALQQIQNYYFTSIIPWQQILAESSPATDSAVASDSIFLSSSSGGAVGDVKFADEDVLNTMPSGDVFPIFDLSDVSISVDVDALFVRDDGSALLSFNRAAYIDGLYIDDSDIVRFIPDSYGAGTSGTFELYLDGSDVGLTWLGEDIDAIHELKNGDLVISTKGTAFLPGIIAKDEDLVRLQPSSLGHTSQGMWFPYFDGSNVGFGDESSEDITGVWVDEDNDALYLSTKGTFMVNSLSGDGADLIRCATTSLAQITSCDFSLYWDGSANGFSNESLDALSLARSIPEFLSNVVNAASYGSQAFATESDELNEDQDDDSQEEIFIYLPLMQ